MPVSAIAGLYVLTETAKIRACPLRGRVLLAEPPGAVGSLAKQDHRDDDDNDCGASTTCVELNCVVSGDTIPKSGNCSANFIMRRSQSRHGLPRGVQSGDARRGTGTRFSASESGILLRVFRRRQRSR
jgi:hypothetical protein